MYGLAVMLSISRLSTSKNIDEIAQILAKKNHKFLILECIPAGGAGHKILCVFLGLVDVYVTSKASTYKWDTCAGNY